MPNQYGKEDSPGDKSYRWTCECGQLLGVLADDPLTGEECLHIKVKDVTIVSNGGPKSWIRRNCQRCGRTWVLTGADTIPKGKEVKKNEL